jgi:serine-type D-Ala-D-Ala carboxypeptidase/endopeptidase (penicillin-binding protein 4)
LGSLAACVAFGLAPASGAGAQPSAPSTPASIVVPAIGGEAWTPDRIAALRRDLDAMLANAPAIRGAHVGVLAVDTKSGSPLYERNAGDAFQPASTLKLVVGSAALEKLGPAFHFTTRGYVAASSPAILLLGGGDPFLTTADLAAFADSIAQLRLPSVSLAVAAGRYDAQPHAPGWSWDDFAYDYAAPISALTLNENVVHIEVAPGARAGDPAHVTSAPLAAAVAGMSSSLLVSNAPSILPAALTLAAGSESTLDVSHLGNDILVSGGIAAGAAPESLDAAVPDASAYAEEVASELLRARHLSVGGPDDTFPFIGVLRGSSEAPSDVRLVWSHDSPPFAEFLGPRFWIPSDNLVAELLLKELGYETGGAPGTSEKGAAFERTWLQSAGVDPATTTLADGSGLSQYDRITPRDLVAILQHDWNGPNRELVLNSLPVGGARGTIEGIAGTPAAGRVFAKTGSMMHVRGLAGYLATEHHGAVTFVFTVDDWLGDYPALAALRAQVLTRIVQD